MLPPPFRDAAPIPTPAAPPSPPARPAECSSARVSSWPLAHLASPKLPRLCFRRDAQSLSFTRAFRSFSSSFSFYFPSFAPFILCSPHGKLRGFSPTFAEGLTCRSFGALRLKSLFVLFFFVPSSHLLFFFFLPLILRLFDPSPLVIVFCVPLRFSPLRDSSCDSLRFTTSCVYIVLSHRNAYV